MSSELNNERPLLDTSDDMISGDLGLGLGLKPGGLRPDITGGDGVDAGLSGFIRRPKRNSFSTSTSPTTCPSTCSATCHYCQCTPALPPCCACEQIPSDEDQEKKRNAKHSKQEDIERKLFLTIQEVEELKTEFETCQQRLESKYEAIRILKTQIEISRLENSSNERKVKSENEQLIKAVNSLQYALEQQESTLMDSQETWARRFDRVCTENARLLSAYEERSEELRKTISQKMALTRERDELLALLDVQEKIKYAKTHNCIDDENDKYSSFSSTELAILGACMCRGHRTEPCGCAYSAANLHKELLKIKEEVDLNRQLRQEAYLTMDAYRYAFEEQLLSTKQLMKCINDLNTRKLKKNSTGFKLSKESEAVLHAVLGHSTEQDGSSTAQDAAAQTSQNLITANLKKLDLDSLDSPYLVTLLLEMLQEKSEVLAFQKLAARILANKVKELQFLQCEHLLQSTYSTNCIREGSKLFTDLSLTTPITTTTTTPTSISTTTPTSINAPISTSKPTTVSASTWRTC